MVKQFLNAFIAKRAINLGCIAYSSILVHYPYPFSIKKKIALPHLSGRAILSHSCYLRPYSCNYLHVIVNEAISSIGDLKYQAIGFGLQIEPAG